MQTGVPITIRMKYCRHNFVPSVHHTKPPRTLRETSIHHTKPSRTLQETSIYHTKPSRTLQETSVHHTKPSRTLRETSVHHTKPSRNEREPNSTAVQYTIRRYTTPAGFFIPSPGKIMLTFAANKGA
jgi:hypothetical protein